MTADLTPTTDATHGQTWACKIGETGTLLRQPADEPMREAVARAYRELTGEDPKFLFSGWDAKLTEPERAAVEDRLPRWGSPEWQLTEAKALLAERDATIARLDAEATTWKTRLVNETETLRGHLTEAREQVAQLTAELRSLETDRDEAVAAIILAQDYLSIDNPAWIILDGYDESGDSIREVEQRMDDGSLHRAPWRWADHAASRMRRAARQARDEASGTTAGGDNRA